MGGRKNRSSPGDGAETDDSGSTDKSSTHFQHLLQLVASSVARRGHASTRQSEGKTGEEGVEGGSEPAVRKQVPLYERAQRRINKHIGIHQEDPQSTHPESILNEDIMRGQDRQLGEIIPSQQIVKELESHHQKWPFVSKKLPSNSVNIAQKPGRDSSPARSVSNLSHWATFLLMRSRQHAC